MKITLHQADSRGVADFGWLHSKHTFSFGHYHHPDRVHFGALRVLNDDIVDGGAGFGTHPHDNMEIISIPLKGDLAHKDSTGTTEVIRSGDVQIMSAGSGLTHSEFNNSKTEKVNFLQIWVIPKERNIKPRYQQITFNTEERKNKIQTVVAPDNDSALWINQDAWFSLTDLNAGNRLDYHLHRANSGVYVFLIDGEAEINGQKLEKRDGAGFDEVNQLNITASVDTQLLLIEVPMAF